MSRTMIAALAAAAALAMSLTACSPGAHPGAGPSARPHPSSSRSPASATPSPTATAAPAARLSTTPGDELLTFSGTGRSTNGSIVAVSFTVHAPVAWNTPAGTSTLAALAAAGSGSELAGNAADDLRNTGWDAANAASLAVVDYSATMTAGSWRPGDVVELDLGPATSEVAVTSAGLAVENGWWNITRPGTGHFVIAYKNPDASAPDPSTWGDSLQIYGLGATRSSDGTLPSYQFSDCRIDITPLGRRSPAVADWFSPNPDYCSAGIGD